MDRTTQMSAITKLQNSLYLNLSGGIDLNNIVRGILIAVYYQYFDPQNHCVSTCCSSGPWDPSGVWKWRAWCSWSVSSVLGLERQWWEWLAPLGHHALLHWPLPCWTADYPGAGWGPNPSLGGDPQRHHHGSSSWIFKITVVIKKKNWAPTNIGTWWCVRLWPWFWIF